MAWLGWRLIRVRGRSMAPSLQDGDHVLVICDFSLPGYLRPLSFPSSHIPMSEVLYFILVLLFLAIWQRFGILLVKIVLSSGFQIFENLWTDILVEFYPDMEGDIAV